MEVRSVTEREFSAYGRVLTGLDENHLNELLKVMENDTPIPEDVIYVPSYDKLECLEITETMSKSVYGNMPVQMGFCNGHNSMLNALEYHRSSEINVAVTDMILMLGRQQDIESDYTYDTSKVEVFYVPAGTVVEMYATTLHYAPCGVDGAGFRCVVVLPKGTNYEVKQKGELAEDKLLAATNKWLIAHSEANIEGAFNGLKGENLNLL